MSNYNRVRTGECEISRTTNESLRARNIANHVCQAHIRRTTKRKATKYSDMRRAQHMVRRRARAVFRLDHRRGRNGTSLLYRFRDGSIMSHLSGEW